MPREFANENVRRTKVVPLKPEFPLQLQRKLTSRIHFGANKVMLFVCRRPNRLTSSCLRRIFRMKLASQTQQAAASLAFRENSINNNDSVSYAIYHSFCELENVTKGWQLDIIESLVNGLSEHLVIFLCVCILCICIRSNNDDRNNNICSRSSRLGCVEAICDGIL